METMEESEDSAQQGNPCIKFSFLNGYVLIDGYYQYASYRCDDALNTQNTKFYSLINYDKTEIGLMVKISQTYMYLRLRILT